MVTATNPGTPTPLPSDAQTPPNSDATNLEPASPRSDWRYHHDGKRDLRIDLLRGFAVFAMVVDHIGGPSWLYAITGGNRFFVSAAEGFVFISGLMVGLVYGTRVRLSGLRAVLPNLLQRAWTLYVLAVWLALGTTLVATVFSLPGRHDISADPARFVWDTVSIQRTSYLVDVMLLYCFLMLLSPLILYALQHRGWPLIALVSFGTWAAYQFVPQYMQLPWPIAGNVVFKLASWQILFVAGLLIGYERQRLGQILRDRVPSRTRQLWPLPVALLFAGLVWLHLTNGAPLGPLTSGDPAGLLDIWFDKSALPPARLAACAVIFALAWALVSRCWRPISFATGWLLRPLGQAALYAYAAHLFLVPVTELVIGRLRPDGAGDGTAALNPGVNAALQLGAVLVLWLLTRARFLSATVAPLGQPPVIRWHRPTTARSLWRPSDAMVLLLVLAMFSAPLSLRLHDGTTLSTRSASTTGSATAVIDHLPESTVTAPRKIAGAAKGSALGNQSLPAAADPAPAPGDPSHGGASAPSDPSQPQPAGSLAALVADVPIPPSDSSELYDEATASFDAPGGYLLDGEFFSQALGRTMPYGIYLPPGYDYGTKRYPVLYMLHGSGGHYSEWVGYGLIEAAEEMIQTGQIPPMIIVLPQGDGSFWVNQAGPGGERWGDYLVYDLVQYIDTTYRTIPEARSRAIGGLSMGAFGALSLGFSHPDIFQMIGAHSPSLRTWEEAPEVLGDRDQYAAIDPVEIAETVDPKNEPAIWLDVGRKDEWAGRVRDFHDRLRELRIAHKFQEKVGEHDSDYWAKQIPQYLMFYAGMSTTE